MKSIKFNVSDEYVINKSKFITKIFKVNDLKEINKYLEEIKEEYKDATHHCYAYIFENEKRFNDDAEPSGTAGMPILNVLEQNELNYVLCVVIRYFGGIKLGAGGLVRAYTKSVTNALEKTKIIELKKGLKVTITFSYDDSKNINYLLKDINILNKEFNELITYTFLIEKDSEIIKELEKYNLTILEELYI